MIDHYVTYTKVLANVEKDVNQFLEIRQKLGCTEIVCRDCDVITSLLDMDQSSIGGPSKCESNCPFKEGAQLKREANGFRFIPSSNYKHLKTEVIYLN